MKISFADGSPEENLGKIAAVLDGRKLAEILAFSLESDSLTVTISKMGTSTLQFRCERKSKGNYWTLEKEKIALAHRAFKKDVLDKLVGVIEKAGGRVEGIA